MAKSIITQFVLKQFAKRSDKKTGVAKLLKETDPIVQSNVRNIKIQLKNLGINPEDLTSTDDVLKALNYHNALMNQHLKQQFKGLGLSKGVDDLAKKKDPFIGWNPRVQQDVDGIIKNLKSMSPMDAMKEANLVIGRKGKYKNLSPDDSQRILKETDDHIFQRDIQYDEFGDPIKPDPEDLASGGIAGPLHLYDGGRARFQDGALAAYQQGQNIIGAPVETQTAPEEISWEPGQAAPEGYEVKRALGDEWIQRIEPSMPPVGPVDPTYMTETGEPASGPGTGITRINKPVTRNPLVDPRMYRSYAENVQLMGDTRMRGAKGGIARVGFKKGGMDRRGFLKLMAGLAALPVVGKFFKPIAKTVGKFKGTPNLVVDITKTPNMPDWYIPAIRKVLKQGEDITDTAATAERQTVHRDILPDGDQVTVTQNMDNQTISVTVENPNAPYLSSTGAGETPYTIQYSKGKVIDEGKYKGQKEADTLDVDEPYTAQIGPEPNDIEIQFDLNTYNPKAEVHDTSVLESYATGKKVKSRGTGEVRDPWEGYSPDLKADDYAKGGRIGYATGTKKRGEGQYSPTKGKDWIQTMPKIDPKLRELMEEHKKRKGLAEILGV